MKKYNQQLNYRNIVKESFTSAKTLPETSKNSKNTISNSKTIFFNIFSYYSRIFSQRRTNKITD